MGTGADAVVPDGLDFLILISSTHASFLASLMISLCNVWNTIIMMRRKQTVDAATTTAGSTPSWKVALQSSSSEGRPGIIEKTTTQERTLFTAVQCAQLGGLGGFAQLGVGDGEVGGGVARAQLCVP